MGRNLEELEAQIQERLRDSFLTTARQRLEESQQAYDAFHAGRGDDLLNEMARAIHDLKGMGDSFGFPSITLAAARVQTQLRSRAQDGSAPVHGLQQCLDIMDGILERGVDPGAEVVEKLLSTH